MTAPLAAPIVEEFLTLDEAAARIGGRRAEMREWIREHVPARRFGDRVVYLMSELRAAGRLASEPAPVAEPAPRVRRLARASY